jgi:hypothetical protein
MKRLHVKLGDEVHQQLEEFSRQENLAVKDRASYLLDAMLGVLARKPDFPLMPVPYQAWSMTKDLDMYLLEDLYDRLFHEAARFGFRPPGFARVLLWTALQFRRRHARESRLLAKESLIEILLENYKRTPVH